MVGVGIETLDLDDFSSDDARFGHRQVYPTNSVGILRSGFDLSQPDRPIGRAISSLNGILETFESGIHLDVDGRR